MDIIVCIKQVQDPDIPPRDFKVDEEKMDVIPPANVSPVINGFAKTPSRRPSTSRKNTAEKSPS